MGKSDKSMLPAGKCNYTEMNHVMGSTSFNFNLKEENGESVIWQNSFHCTSFCINENMGLFVIYQVFIGV